MGSHGDGNAHETDDGRIATVDVANFEILAAIRESGCALCLQAEAGFENEAHLGLGGR
jgi:hypothetical protein